MYANARAYFLGGGIYTSNDAVISKDFTSKKVSRCAAPKRLDVLTDLVKATHS